MLNYRSRLLRLGAAPLRLGLRRASGESSGGKAPGAKKPSFSGAKYGAEHAGEVSASQGLHDMGPGRYKYLMDFQRSLQRGKVKLDQKPLSAREIAEEDSRSQALVLIGRSMAAGAVLVLACFGVGWQMTKWYLGISSVTDFNEAMRQRIPQVSNDAKDSVLGRKLQEVSTTSRDAISESESLTALRRQVRVKFNTPEGAVIARQNSILLSEKRQQERVARKAPKPADGAAGGVSAAGGAAADGAAGTTETADELASAVAAAAAADAPIGGEPTASTGLVTAAGSDSEVVVVAADARIEAADPTAATVATDAAKNEPKGGDEPADNTGLVTVVAFEPEVVVPADTK